MRRAQVTQTGDVVLLQIRTHLQVTHEVMFSQFLSEEGQEPLMRLRNALTTTVHSEELPKHTRVT